MSAEIPGISPELHRQLGVDLFNYTWELIDKPARTPAEDDEMIHCAHASRHHWGQVGAPVNFVRGEWQVSRVYAVLKRPEPARYHAQRCLELCLQHGITDFDLAFAYEALARAAALAGERTAALAYLEQARQAGAGITEDDDREIFNNDLATIPVD